MNQINLNNFFGLHCALCVFAVFLVTYLQLGTKGTTVHKVHEGLHHATVII